MSMVKQSSHLSLIELEQLKWLLGGVLALLSLWSLAGLEFTGKASLVWATGLVVWSILFPRACARLPRRIWTYAGPIILLAAGTDFVLNFPNFLPSLVRLVLWLLLYRCMAQRRIREDMQLVLLCLFCLVISGALTVSLLFALQILIFTPLAMTVMFVLSLLDHNGEQYDEDLWQGFRWKTLMPRIWQVMDFRVWGAAALMFIFMVTVSSILFMLMPRFNLDQAIPFLDIQGQARSGFSNDVSLRDVSEIREDNSVALRVDVPSLEAVSTTPYWRMLVLDQYESGRFRLSPSAERLLSKEVAVSDIRPFDRGYTSREPESWTFYLEGGISQYLPVPGAFGKIRFQLQQDVEMLPALGVYGLDKVKQSVFAYRIDGLEWRNRIPGAEYETSLWESRDERETEPDAETYPETLLSLEVDSTERDYLRQVNAGLYTVDELIEAVDYSERLTTYLRARYQYSLSPTATDSEGDPVVAWLRDGSRGHCELFAAGFVLLAREAGFPARMAIGFSGGSWNAVEEYFVVRNRQAHAWVEIFDADSQAWLRVDPTPGAGSSNPEMMQRGEVHVESGWSAWMDSLRIQWYRRVVNFDQQDQLTIALAIKAVWQDMKQVVAQRLLSLKEALHGVLVRPFSSDSMLSLLLATLLGLLGWCCWRYRDRLWPKLILSSRGRLRMTPIRRDAQRLLIRVRSRRKRSSPADAVDLSQLQAELEGLRFGPDPDPGEARAILKRVRRKLGFWF